MERIRAAALMALLSTGCGGLTVSEYVTKFATPYCAKLKGCYSSDFDAAYPKGNDACIDTFTRGFTKKQIEATSACTDEQVNACLNAIDALQCGKTLSDTSVPTACNCQ